MVDFQTAANQGIHTWSTASAQLAIFLSNEAKKAIHKISKNLNEYRKIDDVRTVAEKLKDHGEKPESEETKGLKNEWNSILEEANNKEELGKLTKNEALEKIERLKDIQKRIGPEATLAAIQNTLKKNPVFKDKLAEVSPTVNAELDSLAESNTIEHVVVHVAHTLTDKDISHYLNNDGKKIASIEPIQLMPMESKRLRDLGNQIKERIKPLTKSGEKIEPELKEGGFGKEELSVSQGPKFTNTAYTKPDSVYVGEQLNIEKRGSVRTITDKAGKILFQFESTNNLNFKVHINNMTSEHYKLFSEVRKNINGDNIKDILSDSTGANQVRNLGPLAPEGSHAIALANDLTNSKKTIHNGDNYTFKRESSGAHPTFCVCRKEEKGEAILATSKTNGAIYADGQTPKEMKLFYEKYNDARNRITAAAQEPISRSKSSDLER